MTPTKAAPLGEEENSLIRIDSHGHCRYTEEFRRVTVAGFERSGLSGIRFARQCGVKYTTFCYWVRRAREERAVHEAQEAAGDVVSSFAVAEIQQPGECADKAVPKAGLRIDDGASDARSEEA